jgi:hypothetical protein
MIIISRFCKFFIFFFYGVYSFPNVFLYVSDGDNGVDEDGCGVLFDRGCKSFSYVFQNRFNDSTIEKAILLPSDYSLSDNGGKVVMNLETPGYYIFGKDYKLGISSEITIPNNYGQFVCERNVNFEHLNFKSSNGAFNYKNSNDSLIFANISGIEVVINTCSFLTASGYNYNTGSDCRLLHAWKGVSVIFENVIAKTFHVRNVNCFRVGDSTDSSVITYVSYVGDDFTNITMVGADALILVTNAIVNLENSNFTNVGQGGKPFLHMFFFFFFII